MLEDMQSEIESINGNTDGMKDRLDDVLEVLESIRDTLQLIVIKLNND